MKNWIKKILCLLFILLTLGISACNNDGPAEEAGETVDNAIEKAGDAIEDAGDKIQKEAN